MIVAQEQLNYHEHSGSVRRREGAIPSLSNACRLIAGAFACSSCADRLYRIMPSNAGWKRSTCGRSLIIVVTFLSIMTGRQMWPEVDRPYQLHGTRSDLILEVMTSKAAAM